MNVRVTSRVTAALTGSLVAIALSGCGSDAVSTEDAQQSLDRAVAAIALASEKAGGAAFELEENGSKGWEISVVKDGQVTEVRVDQGGETVDGTRPDGPIDADDAARLGAATVSMSDALKTAAKASPGAVESIDMDDHAGAVVWTVELHDGKSGIDVSVDTKTGQIVDTVKD